MTTHNGPSLYFVAMVLSSLGPANVQECQATDNLWVCLICGSVLCGSRHEDHVRRHYTNTLHAYAIEIGKTPLVFPLLYFYYAVNFVCSRIDTTTRLPLTCFRTYIYIYIQGSIGIFVNIFLLYQKWLSSYVLLTSIYIFICT